jgi:hypothetical protein
MRLGIRRHRWGPRNFGTSKSFLSKLKGALPTIEEIKAEPGR